MNNLIKLNKVSKHYKQGNRLIKAVDGIDLEVREGDFLVIVGPSGSGKSTLLQLIGGLDRPTSGSINIASNDLSKLSEGMITKLRRENIGFVFQNFNLIPTLTAGQNIEAAIAKRSINDRERVKEMLKTVGLLDRANHLPSLLSGGEQQRVAIGRALINHPKIILADEPTGNLDSRTGKEIMELLTNINKKNKQTVIMITHWENVRKYASDMAEIRDGKLKLI